MAKFCGKCGSKLNEQGKCPSCNKGINKITIKKGTERNINPLIKWSVIVAIIIAVITIGVIIVVSLVDNRDNNDGNSDIPTIDANDYFENNSTILSTVKVEDSDKIRSEADVYKDFSARGFSKYSITTEYSLDGEYYDSVVISETSTAKHPMYQTYYVTENGDYWSIFEINGAMMASPLSYNLESGENVQIVVSETDTVTSYDSVTNQFFITEPKDTVMIVIKVNKIDSTALDNFDWDAVVNKNAQ